MTEDEAKTKACCGSGFRPMENGCCIASACMAWRWEKNVWSGGPGGARDPSVAVSGTTAEYRVPILSKTEGHCGLAGQP